MSQLNFWGVEKNSDKIVNVASVPHRSPFRYPGGKTWLVPRIREWLGNSTYKPKIFVEPFAGGAIVSLTVAFENLADKVIMVELDEQVASVWHIIINTKDGASWLADQIVDFELTQNSARELLNKRTGSRKELALKTIVQNRISHGGILADGAGIIKNGENGKGILSRWYPGTLKKRILNIVKIRERLRFIQGDGFETIKKYLDNTDAVFFIDPPYTASQKRAGARLYKYHEVDHEKLFSLMERAKGEFLMTYDDAAEVRSLAVKHRFETRLIAMKGTQHTKMTEVLIGRDLTWFDRS